MTDLPDLSRVRMLVLDFDGVLTDNTVTVTSGGVESVTCWRGDGIGTAALIAAGIPVLVLSKERDPVVRVRCDKLGLECHQGVDDKAPVLAGLLADRGIDPADVVYVGNDVNDLGCLALVGVPAVVADAHPDVMGAARYVTRALGGRGAVREVCDLIMAAQAAAAGRSQAGGPR
jgi:N-acylneuraminate cytidylyltransferase